MLKTILLGTALFFSHVLLVSASSPEDLAAECVASVHRLVDRYETDAASSTRECIRKINALQGAGREEAAIQVARSCVTEATRKASLVGETIQSICDRCTNELVNLGAFGLARRVDAACGESLETLRAILERQKEAIGAALAD